MEADGSCIYHGVLLEGLPRPASPLGPKPADMRAREAEASRLTALLSGQRPICFLRLGDMELSYLLAHQDGFFGRVPHDDGPTDGTVPCGNPGLTHRHAERLWRAFREADYVDFHERLWPNSVLLPRLELRRAAHLHRNPDAETSYILLTWVEKHFKTFCEGRRVGIAGAEASLLAALVKREKFRSLAEAYWPVDAEISFHQVRNDGRELDDNLDLIKEDLRDFVGANRLDTLFLSLGGGAKILCYELSRELGICAVDFGAMLRGLTYSASDGGRAARSFHTPFFYRVPVSLYVDALEEAFPMLPPERFLAKVHAQLLLELQHKESGWTHAVWEDDYGFDNVRRFRESCRQVAPRCRVLARRSPAVRRERAGFLHYCGKRGLTFDGRAFYIWFRLKSMMKSIFSADA